MAGAILTSQIDLTGAGYYPGDTGFFDQGGNVTASYRVDTADVGVFPHVGQVRTYTITDAGSGYSVQIGSGGDGVPTVLGGPQPGTGNGFIIDILSVSDGSGNRSWFR